MTWRFAENNLTVARTPQPVRVSGYRKRYFEPPGYDGISAVLDDGRKAVRITVTLLAESYEEYEALSALLESGTDGNLEVPHDGDHWVYADAFVAADASWEHVIPDELYRIQVEFICPDPRPRWKSSGERVF